MATQAEHKDEELLLDPHEPKPRSIFQLLIVIQWDVIPLLIAMVLAMGVGAGPLVFFYVLGNSVTDLTSATGDQVQNVISNMALNMTYIAIAVTVIAFFASLLFGITSQRIGVKMRQRFFNQVTRQEIGYFDIKKAGAIANAVSDDASKATDLFAQYLQVVSQCMVQIIGGLIFAFVIRWSITLFHLTGAAFFFMATAVQAVILSKLATQTSIRTGDSMSTANEVITSMKTVRSMAGEEKEVSRYSRLLDRIKLLGLMTSLTRGVCSMLMYWFFHAAQAIAFWWGAVELNNGSIGIGDFVKVYGFMLVCQIATFDMMNVMPDFFKSQASILQILKYLLRKPVLRFRGGLAVPELKGNITFKDVTFRYPARPNVVVLKNFNLDIKSGTCVALVGSSGSGKSTTIGLLEKWYEQESGLVQVDGVDIRELDPIWWHRYLGLVPQEPTLFLGTIGKNISYAVDTINGHIRTQANKDKKSEEEIQQLLIPVSQELIEQAARAANAHEFIMKLPDQYDTIIGERGVSLSGGQKQRIAIARAVLQDPKILLLDEATSALDVKSESLVQDALDKLMVNRTCIVIAHRLTTIQDCDNIVVMRQGEVVEMGKHDELIQNAQGAYYKLAHKQMQFGRSESNSNLSSHSEEDSTSEPASRSSIDTSRASIERPIVQEATSLENVQENILTPTTVVSKRESRRKRRYQLANDEQVKDIHEPKLRNPFKIMKLLGWEVIFILLGGFFALGQGVTPAMVYYFLGQVINAATPIRNADGSIIPFPPGYSLYDATVVAARNLTILAAVGSINFGSFFLFTSLAYERITLRIRRLFFTAITRQEMGFFDIKKSGNLLSTLSEDVGNLVFGLTTKFSLFCNGMGYFIVGVIVTLVNSWQIGLVTFAVTSLSIGIIIFISSVTITYWNKKIIKITQSALTTANEVIGSIRTVRSIAGEEREQLRFGQDLSKLLWAGVWRSFAIAFMMSGIQFCIYAISALVFYYGGTLLASGQILPGTLVNAFGNMVFAILGVSNALSEVQSFAKSFASAHEVLLVTERTPAITPEGGILPEKIIGNIEFKDVTFEYPSRPGVTIMKNFNLTIAKGQHVALVGESGSGKSTITGLLERFYDPVQGTVLLDGQDLRTIDVRWLHKNISAVTQEPVLFATTIRKNITYAVGDENVTMDQVIQCAIDANCHDFIVNLPNGYDTVIGERGVSMSGGQKQRIAIARAMIQNAPVLLLDEATSALDTEAEQVVQDALNKLVVGRTTIVIAHRLSTIMDSDVIVAMKSGEIVEMGTHDELINKQGLYFKLAQKQLEFGQTNRSSVVITKDD
jgi:ATP-binding cassette subfamily B (MDR/TAP) protein 1